MSRKSQSRRKVSKPAKTRKPLHARKSVQEANRKMLDFFSNQIHELRKEMGEFEQKVSKSNEQLWKNQEQEKRGLDTAEEHVVLLRRVLNDALGGITRVTSIERRAEGSTETEEAQVIDWGWYGEQLHYSDDRSQFMNGVVLTDEEVEERREKERVERRHNVVLYLAGRAAEADEDKLRQVYDEGGLDEHLQTFLPPKVVWEPEMEQISGKLVGQVLDQREAAHRQQAKIERAKERSIVRSAVHRVLAAGDENVLRGHEGEDEMVKVVAAALPTVVQWTESMHGMLDEVVAEVLKAEDEKREENDPEEVEAAKQELLEETKKFGEDAAEVIKLIEDGEEDEAREAMARLESQVKAKEAEADVRGAPPIPEGAEVFGG